MNPFPVCPFPIQPASVYRGGNSQPFHNFVLSIDSADWMRTGISVVRYSREQDWDNKNVARRCDWVAERVRVLEESDGVVNPGDEPQRWLGHALVDIVKGNGNAEPGQMMEMDYLGAWTKGGRN